MAYLRSTSVGGAAADASGHIDFIAKLITFLTGLVAPPTTVVGVGGTRMRYVRALAGAVAETWTVTCTDAGAGTWSVVGSVSGAQANAVTGTPYSNAYVSFTLANIAGAAALSDQVTFQVAPSTLTTAGYGWELYTFAYDDRYYLRGLGLSGSDQIYAVIVIHTDAPSDIRNLQVYGAKGFLEPTVGAVTTIDPSSVIGVPLWAGTIPYAFIANGRRFMAVANASGIWGSLHAGLLLPTGTPSEYPYPLAIGGSHRDAARRYSDNQTNGADGHKHRAFWNPCGALQVLRKSGTWTTFENYDTNGNEAATHRVSPFAEQNINTNIDGTYTLFPTTVVSSSPKDVLGELQGVYMVSGYSNAPGNIVVADGFDHLVVNNTYRLNTNEFAAFRLE